METRIFTFGHGQTCRYTGKDLMDHYVTVNAPTVPQCREVMFAVFGREWAFEYLNPEDAGVGQFNMTEHASLTVGAQ